jgi:hypothetical protein
VARLKLQALFKPFIQAFYAYPLFIRLAAELLFLQIICKSSANQMIKFPEMGKLRSKIFAKGEMSVARRNN